MAEESNPGNIDTRQSVKDQNMLVKRTQGVSGFGKFVASVINLPKYVKVFSDIGIDFSQIGRNQQIGVSRRTSEETDIHVATLKEEGVEVADKSVPYFKQNYINKLEILRTFSTHPEIEFILETITDEAVVYDKNGYFCQLILQDYALDNNKKVENTAKESFKRLYTLFGFHDGITVWNYMYQFLIEGTLMFEKIFDDKENPTKIVGIEELQPNTLVPLIIEKEFEEDSQEESKEGEEGENNVEPKKKYKKKVKIWKQFTKGKDGTVEEKIIPDEAIIYISFNRVPGAKTRISYLERLIRSFNLMRTMENTNVAWHVMNSQFRMKMIVPVGSKTTAKAKQAMSVISNKYKEDLTIDHISGEVLINGQTNINYGRSIVLPKRQGESPDIGSFAYEGPDLSRIAAVQHFEKKLWRDSKLPWSRFDREKGGGTRVVFGTEGVPYDEQAFLRFVERIRKEFQRIIVDAVYTDCILREKSLKIDSEFKSKLGIVYESNSYVAMAKEMEVQGQKLKNIKDWEGQKDIDGKTPLMSKKFLYVDFQGLMSEEDWDRHNEYLKLIHLKCDHCLVQF